MPATQRPEMVIFKSDKILPLTHIVCTGRFSFLFYLKITIILAINNGDKILLKFFKDKKIQNRMIEKQLQGEKVTISLQFLVEKPLS